MKSNSKSPRVRSGSKNGKPALTEAFGKVIHKSSLNSDLKLKMKEYLDKLNDSSTRENSFQQLKTIITKYTSIEQVKIILPILISYSSAVPSQIGREYQIILIAYALSVGFIKSSDRQVLSKLIEAVACYLGDNTLNIHKACSVVIIELYDLIVKHEDKKSAIDFIVNYFIGLIEKNHSAVSDEKFNGIVNGSFAIIDDLISYACLHKEEEAQKENNEDMESTFSSLLNNLLKMIKVYKYKNPHLLEAIAHLIDVISLFTFDTTIKSVIPIFLHILCINDASIYLTKIEICSILSHLGIKIAKVNDAETTKSFNVNDIIAALTYATKDRVSKVQVAANESLYYWKCLDPNVEKDNEIKPKMSKLNLLRNLSKINKEKNIMMTPKEVRKQIYDVGIGKFLRTASYIGNREEENLKSLKRFGNKKMKTANSDGFKDFKLSATKMGKGKGSKDFQFCSNYDWQKGEFDEEKINEGDNMENKEEEKKSKEESKENSRNKSKSSIDSVNNKTMSKKSKNSSKEIPTDDNKPKEVKKYDSNKEIVKEENKEDNLIEKENINNKEENKEEDIMSERSHKDEVKEEEEKPSSKISDNKIAFEQESVKGDECANIEEEDNDNPNEEVSSQLSETPSKKTNSKQESIKESPIRQNTSKSNNNITVSNQEQSIHNEEEEESEKENIEETSKQILTFKNEDIPNPDEANINVIETKQHKKKSFINKPIEPEEEIKEESKEKSRKSSSKINKETLQSIFNQISLSVNKELDKVTKSFEDKINDKLNNLDKKITNLSNMLAIHQLQHQKENEFKQNNLLPIKSTDSIPSLNQPHPPFIDIKSNDLIEEENEESTETELADIPDTNKPNNIWETILSYVNQSNYEQAYLTAMNSGDDLLLIRLLFTTKEKCLINIPCKIGVKLISRINSIFRCFMIQNIILDFFSEFYNLDMFKMLSLNEANDIMQTIYEISQCEGEIGKKANYIYNTIKSNNNIPNKTINNI